MNGSLKKSSRTLYGVCLCIIVLMVMCYFGVSLSKKGTYGACSGTIVGSCCYNCPSGYTFNESTKVCGKKVAVGVSEDDISDYDYCIIDGNEYVDGIPTGSL